MQLVTGRVQIDIWNSVGLVYSRTLGGLQLANISFNDICQPGDCRQPQYNILVVDPQKHARSSRMTMYSTEGNRLPLEVRSNEFEAFSSR